MSLPGNIQRLSVHLCLNTCLEAKTCVIYLHTQITEKSHMWKKRANV